MLPELTSRRRQTQTKRNNPGDVECELCADERHNLHCQVSEIENSSCVTTAALHPWAQPPL